jgi:hypothetical protein
LLSSTFPVVASVLLLLLGKAALIAHSYDTPAGIPTSTMGKNRGSKGGKQARKAKEKKQKLEQEEQKEAIRREQQKQINLERFKQLTREVFNGFIFADTIHACGCRDTRSAIASDSVSRNLKMLLDPPVPDVLLPKSLSQGLHIDAEFMYSVYSTDAICPYCASGGMSPHPNVENYHKTMYHRPFILRKWTPLCPHPQQAVGNAIFHTADPGVPLGKFLHTRAVAPCQCLFPPPGDLISGLHTEAEMAYQHSNHVGWCQPCGEKLQEHICGCLDCFTEFAFTAVEMENAGFRGEDELDWLANSALPKACKERVESPTWAGDIRGRYFGSKM